MWMCIYKGGRKKGIKKVDDRFRFSPTLDHTHTRASQFGCAELFYGGRKDN